MAGRGLAEPSRGRYVWAFMLRVYAWMGCGTVDAAWAVTVRGRSLLSSILVMALRTVYVECGASEAARPRVQAPAAAHASDTLFHSLACTEHAALFHLFRGK